MRTDADIFAGSAAFFAIATAVYWYTAGEPAGTVLLGAMALISAMMALALELKIRSGAAADPQEDPEANPEAGADQEVGRFPTDSALPMLLSVACSIVAVGLVVGLSLLLLGFVAFACSVTVLLRRSI